MAVTGEAAVHANTQLVAHIMLQTRVDLYTAQYGNVSNILYNTILYYTILYYTIQEVQFPLLNMKN